MTSTEDDRNQYLAAKYKERIEAMLDRQQVGFDRQCTLKIVPSGLSENEKVFGMDRLIVFLVVSTQL